MLQDNANLYILNNYKKKIVDVILVILNLFQKLTINKWSRMNSFARYTFYDS